jgi:hypothetical protein
MNTLTIDVRSLTDILAEAALAMETGQAQGARYSFSSPQALMRTLGGKRFDLIQALSGAGPVTIREAAGAWGATSKPSTPTSRPCWLAACWTRRTTERSCFRLMQCTWISRRRTREKIRQRP